VTVAICLDPAGSTSTFSPCRTNTSLTRWSAKKASFSEPITPRTVSSREGWSPPCPRTIAVTTPTRSTTARPMPSVLFIDHLTAELLVGEQIFRHSDARAW
jgi:hypothetical protein